ncbi:MAG: hypothetical protein LBS52_07630 [Dysgonamonadaceae bacterium]|jgi:hypothetical protein|nr:hypothetical protein [Dysgonamonadaceae bacterium]
MEEKEKICSKCGKSYDDCQLKIKNFVCDNCLKENLEIGEWTLTQERGYMEKLQLERFNYFLVAFTLITTAGFANNFSNYKSMIFFFGAFLLLMCWIPIFRATKKLNCILKIIYNADNHTITIIENLLRNRGFKHFFVVSHWIGYYIPALCILFLSIIGFLVFFDIMKSC